MGKDAGIPRSPGTYLLVLHLDTDRAIRVGRLGEFHFRAGYYVYVGSARGPGGLRARLERHARGGARRHWHVDYLRRWARPVEVWYAPGSEPWECLWQAALGAQTSLCQPIPGFGASDCRCPAHLFFSLERRAISEAVERAVRSPLLARAAVIERAASRK
jgi:Uri superfamily endonuclease